MNRQVGVKASDLVTVNIPADVAAVIAAAATTAISRGDTIPTSAVVVINAVVAAFVPNARAITITKVERQERTRRVRYRKRPAEMAWAMQGRAAIMNSHLPKR